MIVRTRAWASCARAKSPVEGQGLGIGAQCIIKLIGVLKSLPGLESVQNSRQLPGPMGAGLGSSVSGVQGKSLLEIAGRSLGVTLLQRQQTGSDGFFEQQLLRSHQLIQGFDGSFTGLLGRRVILRLEQAITLSGQGDRTVIGVTTPGPDIHGLGLRLFLQPHCHQPVQLP